MKFNLPIPSDLIEIQSVFKDNGYKLYIVGGAVRDALLKKPIKDYDLATDAIPDIVENILNKNGFKTLATGKAFGVINVFTGNNEYEIATFREDSKTGDGRRPDSVSFTDIVTDVNRRDLTINGLFYDIEKREIVDLVGGIQDLKNKIVRTIGSPKDRFEEDKLRILRALRFAGRFNSNLDGKIDAVLKQGVSLKGISFERIRDEFIKGIKTSISSVFFLKLIEEYNLMIQIFPNLNHSNDYIESKDYILVIAVLLRNNDEIKIVSELKKITYTVDEVRNIKFLVSLSNLNLSNAFKIKTSQKNTTVSNEQIEKFGKFVGVSTKLIQAFTRFKLSVTGQDVMNTFNIQSGRQVGAYIEKLETENFIKIYS